MYVFERTGPMAGQRGSGMMATGGCARGKRDGSAGLAVALAGAVLAALLVADGSAAGPALAILTGCAAVLAAGLRIAGGHLAGRAPALARVPQVLALVLSGAAVWSALAGRDPATGLVAVGLVLAGAHVARPGWPGWVEAATGTGLAGLALAHRLL